MIKNESERTGLLFNNPRPKLRSKGKVNHLELIRLEQQRDAKILRQIFLSFLVSDELASQPHSSKNLPIQQLLGAGSYKGLFRGSGA